MAKSAKKIALVMSEISRDSQCKQIPSGTCRACMLFDDSSRMIFLFESSNNLAEIFSKCTSLVATDENDGLPKHIYLCCHNDLVNYNKFRLLRTSSDTYFRQNMKIEHREPVSEDRIIEEDQYDIVETVKDRLESDSVGSEIIEETKDEPLCVDSSPEADDINATTEAETDIGNLDAGQPGSENANKKSMLSCEQCGKKIFKLLRLEGHLRQHQGLMPCICEICGKAFSKWSGLSLHMSGWHNDKPDKKQFPCDAGNCDKAFMKYGLEAYNMKQSLILHKKIRHSDTAIVQEIKSVCEVCGKPFKTSKALKKHTYTHTGYENMPYSCTLCPKKYTTKHKLKEHTMRHNGVKNHICPFCGLRKTT